jgi:hypothetical protein
MAADTRTLASATTRSSGGVALRAGGLELLVRESHRLLLASGHAGKATGRPPRRAGEVCLTDLEDVRPPRYCRPAFADLAFCADSQLGHTVE